MTSELTILVSADYYDQFLDRFKELGEPHYRWLRLAWPERDCNLTEKLVDTDVIISRMDLLDEDFNHAPRLKLFQIPTSGYDHISLARAARHGFSLPTTEEPTLFL